jgi:uncharacterized membrane protein YhiD involved in acid resistance
MTNFLDYSIAEFSSAVILFNLVFAFLLGLAIAWTYIKTHRGLSYSQSFIFTLVILAILGSVVMMIVRNNLIGAFALLGAFSLIRFRTIIKETKDVAFLFFSLATGVAVGTNNYMVAIMTTIFVSLVIFILTKYNFGSLTKGGALVTFTANGDFRDDGYKNIFKNYLKSYSLLQIKSSAENLREYSFAIRFRDEGETDKFIEKLQALSGVENADIITGKNANEY